MLKVRVNRNNKIFCLVNFLLIPILLTSLVSCNKSGNLSNRTLSESNQIAELVQVGNHSVTVINRTLLKDTIILPLSHLTEELQIVKLDDSNDNYFVKETYAKVTNQYILVYGTWSVPFKLFDKSGKFITDIGRHGQGPNEYRYIYDAQLNESNNRIYLLPYIDDKILVYDLDGKYFTPIPLSFKTDIFNKFQVNSIDSTISVFRPLVTNNDFMLPFCVWNQNMYGKLIHGISSPSYAVGINQENPFHNRIFVDKNTEYLDFSFFGDTPVKDSLYHYDEINNELIPKFTVNFGNRSIPWHRYYELPNHYISFTYDLEEVNDHIEGTYKDIANPEYFIVDKITLKGSFFRLVNDFLGNIEIEFDSDKSIFANGYYTANYEPTSFIKILEYALENNDMPSEMKRKIIDLKNSIDENGNNYILYAKLKK